MQYTKLMSCERERAIVGSDKETDESSVDLGCAASDVWVAKCACVFEAVCVLCACV